MNTIIETRTIKDPKIAGLSYRIDIVPDYDADSPADLLYPEGSYTQKQVDAWERDEWSYVGVIVTPKIADMDLDRFADSLWCVEYGYYLLTDDQDNETGRTWLGMDEFIKTHPVPDMLEQVKAQLNDGLGGVVDALRAAQKAMVEATQEVRS